MEHFWGAEMIISTLGRVRFSAETST